MKHLILLIAIHLMSLGAIMAQYAPSILNLKMYNNANFYCTVDGVNYNQANATQRIENLTPGNHFINVYVSQWMYGGGNTQRLVYSGNVYVQANAELFATITGSNLNVDRVVALQAPMNNGGYGGYDPYAYNPNQYDRDYEGRDYHGRGNHGNNNHDNGYGYGRGNYGRPGPGQCGTPPAPPVCNSPRPMCDADFNALINNIRNGSFESTKLSIANTVLRSNNFTTQQVKSILRQFSFESTKLEFAKNAYANTIDKNNYYLVNDAFSFSSSTIELNNFIASR